MPASEQIINETKNWINTVVIGCNFCPFAAPAVKQKTIFYRVEPAASMNICLESFLQELTRLDDDETIDTTFLILPLACIQFDDYLDLVTAAEKLLSQKKYDGVYQIASFHPRYCFAGAPDDDAANYTNRSVYPMLHLLRESSISKALEHYSDPGSIPERNIQFARAKGIVYMKMLRDSCSSDID
ncbi:MAG: DUF1415 domain-containing protein [Chitinophagaceae bacterium]|nr:DUF1415 domain-containing protein [Chitinophagaceae bacterium]